MEVDVGDGCGLEDEDDNVSLEEDRKCRRRREHGFPSTESVDGNPCSLLQGAQYIRTYGRREEERSSRRRDGSTDGRKKKPSVVVEWK